MSQPDKVVTAQAVRNLLEFAQNCGIGVDRLVQGLQISEAELRSPAIRLDWEMFATLWLHFAECLHEGQLEKFARQSPFQNANAFMRRLTGYFTRVQLIYWALTRFYVHKLFPHMLATYEDLPDGRIRMVLEIPAGFAPIHPTFFQVWKESLAVTPALLGQPDAVVEAEITPHRGVFLITPPPRLTAWQRGRSYWRAIFAARAAIEQLAQQSSQIENYYKELLAVQKRVADQEARLSLASQLASVSRLSALGEMAGGMAHEINTPLASISLNAQLISKALQREPLDHALIAQSAEKISSTSFRIAAIIQGLRKLSRDDEKDPVSDVSLAETLNEAFLFCREQMRNQGIEFAIQAVDPALRMHCRPVQLTQVLLNLINNAADAVSRSDVKQVSIAARDQGRSIEISVTDSGPGVPPELRERIFQPFFTTKEIGRGTGLGLSISKGLMASQSGTLTLDAVDGATRFTITVPSADRSTAVPR